MFYTKFATSIEKELEKQNINFDEINTITEFDNMYTVFLDVIKENARRFIKQRKSFFTPKIVWWTSELRVLRNKAAALYKKSKKPSATLADQLKYRNEKALYKKAIQKARETAWTNMCKNESDPFGKMKQLAFGKYKDQNVYSISNANVSQPISRLSVLKDVTEQIFGHSTPGHNFLLPIPINDQIPFTLSEVRKAFFSFNKNKAPGPDEIDHNMARAMFLKFPHTFLKMFITLLKLNYFPTAWKIGELVYFRKEGKPTFLASSYRPITLLPVLGKVFEKLLLKRINYVLHHNQLLSGKQHGFVERRSTESALLQAISLIKLNKQRNNYTSLISIDFKGAFDNLPWLNSILSLRRLKVPQQYINLISSFLTDRRAQMDWMNPHIEHYFNKGCPQGSCLGPFLWVALLETLLSISMGTNCSLIAYADDLLLVTWGSSRSILEKEGNAALKIIEDWAILNNIQISIEKSSCITFGKPKKLKRPPIFKIYNQNLKNVKCLAYLGVTLDLSLSFLPHLKNKRLEVQKITQNLYRFSSINGRLPLHFFTVWYKSILLRKLSYACSVWFPNMWSSHGRRHLLAAQRKVLLLISRAYRKTSTLALQTLTGLPPLDIQLECEAEFSLVIRLGISTETYFAPQYYGKCSKYEIDPTWEGIQEEELSQYKNFIHIYTDGSKSNQGTASAFCVFKENALLHTWKACLSNQNSIFQAELFAIKNAVLWANLDENTAFLISSDSLSGLLALQNTDTVDFMISDILNLIKNSSKSFYFKWVKGHSGITGNELADSLAKEAVQDNDVLSGFLPLPSSHLKYKLQQKLKNDWQQRWDIEDTGRYTHNLLPRVPIDFTLDNRYLFLFFTNHGPFQKYLYDIGKRDSPLCVCGSLSTSLHYVLDCPLTQCYHVKKHRDMTIPEWIKYISERPVLLNKISRLMKFVENNEVIFRNNYPYFSDISSDDEL